MMKSHPASPCLANQLTTQCNELNENSENQFQEIANDFCEGIIAWYKVYGRVFPWRVDEPNAYKLLITEILLQKTNANAVAKLYVDFFRKYPKPISIFLEDISILEQKLRSLGLKKRVKTIKEVGKFIIECWNGNIPETTAELIKIKGIGKYTANSVLYSAFNKPIIAVDSNVARIISRYFGIDYKKEHRKIPKDISNLANCLPVAEPRNLNYGLLDLGAKICKSRNPRCEICPLNKECHFLKNYEINQTGIT